jgi:transglutaminase-like putative cysteine protease
MRQQSFFILLFVLAACLFAFDSLGQDAVTTPLTDSLRQGAAAVRRLEVMEITIESSHKARVHHKWVNTILNASGDTHGLIYTFYDKFHDLSSVSATIYDAEGKAIRKIKKSDLVDAPISGMGMLAMDTRVKYYPITHSNYPYSVSYEEEIVLDNLFVLPQQWFPQPAQNMAVVSSSLIVHVPGDYPLHYREYDLPAHAVITEKKGVKTYTWELTNRPALIPESYAVAWHRREPCVKLSPGSFEMGGYKGSADSWAQLGKFAGDLFQGRGQLPEGARQQVHSLVDGLPDDRAKIEALYSWMQQNTHYVGVSLGIGGWQPYDATYVYTRKYGECKALSNFMVALLKEAGIRAWPVLVYGGPEPPSVDTGFACQQFNHCIAVALAGSDSVWLECTSSTQAPGYLGSFTADRYALLLDDAGGRLVRTPAYGVRENRIIRKLRGRIGENGSLEADLHVGYTGLEQDVPQAMIDKLAKKDLLEETRRSFGINDCTISDWNSISTRAAVPMLEETMHLSAEHFATVSGNRLIIIPGRFMRRTSRLMSNAARKTAIELRLSVNESDSIVLQIPHGYVPEHLPSGHFTDPFGSYNIHGSFENDVLTVSCRYIEQKGVYAPEMYDRMVRFFDFTWREGNQQIVFLKQ